jgi:hypothetical protein
MYAPTESMTIAPRAEPRHHQNSSRNAMAPALDFGGYASKRPSRPMTIRTIIVHDPISPVSWDPHTA